MPWTVADVERHKKGLTDKQKRQWVHIANSALARCKAKGGTDCEGSAIRQANGVVGHAAMYVNTVNVDYEIRETTHQGRKHIVVPVIMMVEGVHHGSHGALFHPAEELGRFVETWNGIPVVIDHPEVDGQNVSANSPDVIDGRTVGRVYGAHMDGGRLMAEAWLDEDKLRQLSAVALAHIVEHQPLEVSVGVFTEDEEITAEWNGEQYTAIARNHRPDHLALLPGGVGACSWADGCGIRANNLEGGNMDTNELKLQNIQAVISNNVDQGYRELVEAAQRKLDAMDSSDVIHFLQEVYDDHVIYEARQRVGGAQMYKQTYAYENGAFTLTGNPTEVRKKVEYVAMERYSLTRTKFNINNKKEVNKMGENEKCTPCVKAKVDALIANSQGKYTEADREVLETLTEELLDKIAKPVEVEKKVEVNVLSEEDKAAIAAYKKQMKEKRDNTIKDIQDNTSKEIWPDEILNTMTDDHLDRLLSSVKKEEAVVYTGSPTMGTNKQAPLYPAGVVIETKK